MTLTASPPSVQPPPLPTRSDTAGSGERQSYDPRRWRSLPVVLSATFMSLFDVFVVNVAAPSIQHDLHASSSTLELVVAGYSFSYAAGLVTGARLGDLFGRRRLFMIGLAIFAAASLLSGVAPTSALLVIGRLAQGFGAAAMVPQVLSMLNVNFRPEERSRVFSLFGVTVGLGTVAGQILGGVLLNVNLFGWGWRPIFLINVPIGIAAIVLSRRLLPESKPDVADRLDPLGVVLLTTGVGAITAPLVLGQAEHWPLWTWVSFVAGAALVVIFLSWESRLGRRGGHPLLPLSLFEHRAFNVGLLVNLGFFSFFGSVLLTLTIFLQEGLKYSPMRAGLTFAPLGVAFALSSIRGRVLHARYGTAVISAGAATALLGVAGLAVVIAVSGLCDFRGRLRFAICVVGRPEQRGAAARGEFDDALSGGQLPGRALLGSGGDVRVAVGVIPDQVPFVVLTPHKSGCPSAFTPTTKNVAGTRFALRMSRTRGVYSGSGPSSKLIDTTLRLPDGIPLASNT